MGSDTVVTNIGTGASGHMPVENEHFVAEALRIVRDNPIRRHEEKIRLLTEYACAFAIKITPSEIALARRVVALAVCLRIQRGVCKQLPAIIAMR